VLAPLLSYLNALSMLGLVGRWKSPGPEF
jgi:hypothetical protein